MTADQVNGEAGSDADLLPVSLLCGFLGAGKTTLLKHILETKHAEEGFKCAVIVNDMATLNIDKSLIDQSAVLQTDEVIAMQNGCFCCTLQSDLVEQIISLAQKKTFNYMLIEASGVSEPSQIAPLFEPCDDEHDHEEEHAEGPQLSEVARLDCCITVVDAAEFYNNLDSMKLYKEGETQGTITELMTEQVEFSNVVILNKQDLVSEEQQLDILDRIQLLNPKAKVIKTQQSKVQVTELLNTRLYSREDMEENSVMISATKVEVEDIVKEKDPDCCITSVAGGKKKCCKPKNDRLIDSGVSQVLLDVIPLDNKMTRHEKRFGISSFVYRARRPFHPGRLHDDLLNPSFMILHEDDDDSESEDESEEASASKTASRAVYVNKPAATQQKPAEEAEHEAEPEPATLFVSDLAEGLTAKKIYKFFEKRDINVGGIRMHRKKPNAYVEVESLEEAQKALALNGKDLAGKPLNIEIRENKRADADQKEELDEEALKKQAEDLKKQQDMALAKKKIRVKMMGELLRSKGFAWIASSHEVMASWQQAGNIIRLEAEGPWLCNMPDMWKDTPNEELILRDMRDSSGKEYKYSDRRQELVFIGVKLSHLAIQTALDDCLLTDEEMALGPDKWAETMADEDTFGLALDLDEEDGDEETGSEASESDAEHEESDSQNEERKRKRPTTSDEPKKTSNLSAKKKKR